MEIEIGGKKYQTKCNAYTRFEYKQIFGVGIFKDLAKLNDLNIKQEAIRESMKGKSEKEIQNAINMALLEDIDEFIDTIERITYIFIKDNQGVGSFKDWLQSLEKIELSDSWIQEVTELAVSSFC